MISSSAIYSYHVFCIGSMALLLHTQHIVSSICNLCSQRQIYHDRIKDLTNLTMQLGLQYTICTADQTTYDDTVIPNTTTILIMTPFIT